MATPKRRAWALLFEDAWAKLRHDGDVFREIRETQKPTREDGPSWTIMLPDAGEVAVKILPP
jgi:hypothetical protein